MVTVTVVAVGWLHESYGCRDIRHQPLSYKLPTLSRAPRPQATLSRASIYWCMHDHQRGTVSCNSRFQALPFQQSSANLSVALLSLPNRPALVPSAPGARRSPRPPCIAPCAVVPRAARRPPCPDPDPAVCAVDPRAMRVRERETSESKFSGRSPTDPGIPPLRHGTSASVKAPIVQTLSLWIDRNGAGLRRPPTWGGPEKGWSKTIELRKGDFETICM